MAESIAAANKEALAAIASATPFLIDIRPAREVIPGLGRWDLLHAGPPIGGWHEACGALRGAILGTLIRNGDAKDSAEAESFAADGTVKLHSAHERGALGTYGGVISAATPVFVIENRAGGTRAFSALNEGRGKALRYGSTDGETLSRLAWLEGEFAELLAQALRLSRGIDLFAILEQALHMGDDGHSRQKAASSLFLNAIAPFVVESGFPAKSVARALRFLGQNDIFFLPLTMAAAKSAMAAAERVAGSTLVTAIAFNGATGGIRLGGLGGRWCTAPVPIARGQYFEGYTESDAGPVIGDSEISETMGLGAFAMAGAPALARYVGGTVEEATRLTTEMYEITLAEHPRFKIPALGYRGTPFGIDVRRVVERGIAPVFNTGIAHRIPGVGQIGAGFGRVPLACFAAAYEALGLGRAAGSD
ncbi:MAG TPA: DUF1116 domain-containing protein [Stellaceae bacterium]|nr:DUF1116 domain-containing protein [Stellaceae bacterium]